MTTGNPRKNQLRKVRMLDNYIKDGGDTLAGSDEFDEASRPVAKTSKAKPMAVKPPAKKRGRPPGRRPGQQSSGGKVGEGSQEEQSGNEDSSAKQPAVEEANA